jgi:hypothetical protein
MTAFLSSESRVGRWLRVLPAAFTGLTVGWIVSALLVPGDYFNPFEPRPIICVGVAGLLGACAGFRVRRRWPHVLLAIGVGLSVAFWALAPDGWWAKRMGRGAVTVPR